MMAESPQKLVIAAESECKYNKWQLFFEVNAALWMQMEAFPLPIIAFSLSVRFYNDVLHMTTLDGWYVGLHRSAASTSERNGKQDPVR